MKKKHILLSILSCSLFGSLFFGITKEAKTVNAEGNQVNRYVTLGPGVYNEKSPEVVGGTNFNDYSLAFRGNNFMFFLNDDTFQGIDNKTQVNASEMVDTDLSLIRIYTSETSYKTLEYYYNETPQNAVINQFNDLGLNVSFPTGGLRAGDIYKVSISEGFVYPYADSSHSVKLIQKNSITLNSVTYGNYTVTDIVYASGWTIEKQFAGPIEELPIAAFAREDGNQGYLAHIRQNTPEWPPNPALKDTCTLILFLGQHNDYNPDISGLDNARYNIRIPSTTFDLSDSPTSFKNTLYNRVHIHLRNGETVSLWDVANPLTKGLPVYNPFGEKSCIGFQIGNKVLLNNQEPYQFEEFDDVSYAAEDIVGITVDRGANFPVYTSTNGDSSTEYRYVQIDTVKLLFLESGYPGWKQAAQLTFSYGETKVLSVDSRDVTIDGENKVVIDIDISESNYGDAVNKEITSFNNDLIRYVYVNGRTIQYLNQDVGTRCFVNLNGKTNTLSITANVKSASEINEIIVQKGTSIPALTSSSDSLDIYKSVASYNVTKSASFTRKSGVFETSEGLTWTVWFDGANPKRVKNSKYFDISDLDFTPTKENAIFDCWVDEDGNKVEGNIQVYSGKEFFSSWKYLHHVTLIIGDERHEFTVNRYSRLTMLEETKDLLYPGNDSAQFLGWFDEDGNRVNIDNQIVKDMVLIAKFDGEYIPSRKGCKGSIISSSIICSLCASFGVVLVKHKKEN